MSFDDFIEIIGVDLLQSEEWSSDDIESNSLKKSFPELKDALLKFQNATNCRFFFNDYIEIWNYCVYIEGWSYTWYQEDCSYEVEYRRYCCNVKTLHDNLAKLGFV
ncbi:hypothetical protein [Scytonema sp. NUACC26]|uniref:hypothetical protein n=1 Tax=Scytonema sp. NUACC26 TaxID=3140176 RepID=UPI0034DBAE8C